MERFFNGRKVEDSTYLGYIPGIFANINEINLTDERKLSIEKFFETIKSELKNIYK